MVQMEACEPRPVQVLRCLISWVAFFLQVFLQILRGTPSFFSYIVGLSSSSCGSLLASFSSSFKPLSVVELPLQEFTVAATSDVTIYDSVGDGGGGDDDEQEMEKLTECDGKPKINYLTVFERPGLHEFLKQLTEFGDIVLFTAGLEGNIENV